MKKIKICYVIVNCKITGPMNQTLNIIKNLNLDRFEPSFITLFDEEVNNSMINEYKKLCKTHKCLHLKRISSVLYGKYVLNKALQEIKPDIIHSLGMPPYRLSLKYKKAKHLVTIRNYAYEDYPSYYNKFIGPILAFLDINLIKRLTKRGEKFVTCSQSLSEIYLNKEHLKIPYIRNGVDTDKYFRVNSEKKDALREKLNIPKDKIMLIYTAPFNARKNQEFAIKAVINSKEKASLSLVLCGNGEDFEILKRKYSNEKNIIFTGKVKNINEYLQASDIYISSSKSEGLPNSVLEAMATGLPIIVSSIQQHLEILNINKKIGYSYEQGNLNDLINILDNIKTYKLKEMGTESYKCIIDNLSSKKMSLKYQELYEDLYKMYEENGND